MNKSFKKISCFFVFFTLFLILSNCLFAQENASQKIVSGRVIDTTNFNVLADVIVVNKRTNKTTITEKDGTFFISMSGKDTLVFYLVGFHSKLFFLPDKEKPFYAVFLKPSSEVLEEISVIGNTKKKEISPYPFNQRPATIENPLSFIYEKYSKRYIQYRKVEELEKEKYYKTLKEIRLSRELVLEITDIRERDVDDFIQKCQFSNEFLERASDYEFFVAIQKKYKFYVENRNR